MENNNIQNPNNGKVAGIISYFWFIGWLISYFAFHKDNKTELGSYQLRQTLLFAIVATVISWTLGAVIILLIGLINIFALVYLLQLINIGFLVLWVVGLIGAIKGEKKPIPFVGELAQRIFPNI
jgi:uncharacterized membrane protein